MVPTFVRTIIDDRIRLAAFSDDNDRKLEMLQTQNSQMKGNLEINQTLIDSLESKILDLQKMEELKEKRILEISQEFSFGMNEATELVERQNDLIVTLQAKVLHLHILILERIILLLHYCCR